MRETDRQASPKPSETVLTARYRVIDPSIITVSVSSLGNTKHEVSFKTRKEKLLSRTVNA
jgi:hypothetical protein